jgi:hypothetical protein
MSTEEKREAMSTLRSFLTLRAYDIISNGQYKKHVVQNKENCENWAINLYADYQKTLLCLRNVTQIQTQLRSSGYDRLATLCNIVSECNEYPFTHNDTWSVCYLTGVRCKHSLQIKRTQLMFTSTKRARLSTSMQMSTMHPNRADDTIDIHSKYRQFLVSYWLLTRFDTVIKVMVRQWMNQPEQYESSDYNFLCRNFCNDVEFQENIEKVFFHSWEHVQLSMSRLVSVKV